MSQLLIIFAKQPMPGCVKTRLGAVIGMSQAAKLYAAFCEDLFSRLQDHPWNRVITFAPADDATEAFFRNWTGAHEVLWRQPAGHLGNRLTDCFSQGFDEASRVVIIGSDAPTLPAEFISQAFSALEHVDCVLGPTMDGGYYLVGLRRPLPELFTEIDWSTSTVLQQTIDRLAAVEGSLHLLPPWYDVDEARDLDLLRGHLRAMELAEQQCPAPRTLQWLTSHES